MIFSYKAIDSTGLERKGNIDAISIDAAISSLQNRGLIISTINPEVEKGGLFKNVTLFSGVKNKDVVILSRQIATMFEAQVSALRVFRMLSGETENKVLAKVLNEISDDIQSGNPISVAMTKHPKIFSAFYVSMVKSGEESGKLDQCFMYLADYLDRNYEITSKVRGALIYPAFIAFTFLVVMILMFTMVIPKISTILTETGQEVPFFTKIILAISSFLVTYGILILILVVVGTFFFIRFAKTDVGKNSIDEFKLKVFGFKTLYRKLYLSRIADNLNTLLLSGISVVRALELTAEVVDNRVYERILKKANEDVKNGSAVSDALGQKKEIPGVFVQMIRVGEETGEMGSILKTMSTFYRREVFTAVDTIVSMIEPVMIVSLALGVGILLAAILMPIYNIGSAM